MNSSHRTNLTSTRSVFLETFGCQMNELDSELVRGQLHALGYRFTQSAEEADVILYNTCSVREQAENKAYSRIGLVGKAKEAGREVVLGVIGCMAERDGIDLMRRHPQVDLMCGPGELDKLPMLIDNALKTTVIQRFSEPMRARTERAALQGSTTRRSSTLAAAEDDLELLDLSRAFDPEFSTSNRRSAYVRITRGCNKFCTYCVVPYTRGPEVHRPPDSIIDECRRLADAGVIEITLLGQTVNHYVYVHGAAVTIHGVEAPQVGPGLGFWKKHGEGSKSRNVDERPSPPTPLPAGEGSREALAPAPLPQGRREKVTTFADLLKRIHDEVPAIERLRFVTSYPRDFTDDALRVMAESPRICRYLHVPAQSGSNRILKLMNRGYTVEEYHDFIDRARSIMPDVSIAGDIIVGFPTETDEDFEMTKDLLHRVRFKNNFIFKYSPRPGTVAIDRFEDDVPEHVKRRRNNDLLAIQAEISAEVHAGHVGRIVDVMIEGVSAQSSKRQGNVELRFERQRVQMSGRTEGDLIVFFDLDEQHSPDDLIGRIVPLRITGSGPMLLRGELARQGAGDLNGYNHGDVCRAT